MNAFNQFINILETPLSLSLVVLFLMLIFSAFLKISLVFGFLRVGLGLDSGIGFFLTMGISLSLTYFVMYPNIQNALSTSPESCKKNSVVCLEHISNHWKDYLSKEVSNQEKEKFLDLYKKINSKNEGNKDSKETLENEVNLNQTTLNDWQILLPSFVVSEIKKAFSIGIKILLPFLVIDLVLAYLLAALGTTSISSSIISFPLKILAFTAVDGWTLVVENLIKGSFGG